MGENEYRRGLRVIETSKLPRFAREGGGIALRQGHNESSSFSNDLMKRQSFRASRGRGGTEFRQGLRVENGTSNRLLSLII